MRLHGNARTCLHSRLLIVRGALSGCPAGNVRVAPVSRPIAHAAFGVCVTAGTRGDRAEVLAQPP
jgi:hypothetical protein